MPFLSENVDAPELLEYTFALVTRVDHDNKCTWLRHYRYGRLLDEQVYKNETHYPLLRTIVEQFRGVGCCDSYRDIKKELSNPNYWNRPLCDPYSDDADIPGIYVEDR